MRFRRPVLYTAISAAAIATTGLLASPAMASTTQFPFQGQGFSLYNNYGSARGTVTGDQFNQYGQYGQYDQWDQGSLTVSGTVSNYRYGQNGYGQNGYGQYGYRQGTIEEVFLSSNSWSRGELIGSAGPGQSDRFSGTLDNTNSGTITLCVANKWGGNVRDCTSQTVTANNQQQYNWHNH